VFLGCCGVCRHRNVGNGEIKVEKILSHGDIVCAMSGMGEVANGGVVGGGWLEEYRETASQCFRYREKTLTEGW
jgi:hypothetical protein